MRYLQIFLIICQLLFLKLVILPAQTINKVVSAKANYDLLLDRFKVYIEYYIVNEEVQSLYSDALEYAELKDYSVASVLLEEAISILKSDQDDAENKDLLTMVSIPGAQKTGTEFKFGIISGIDYNNQEFEVGFFESDSVVREEINKPYLGLSTRIKTIYAEHGFLDFYNSLRYDRENLRDDYRIRWQTNADFYIQYAGYWNQAQVSESSSYWDQILSARMGNQITSDLTFTLLNNFNYKSYRIFSLYLRDYYRNRFNGFLEWKASVLGTVGIEYINEFNETLGHSDNDYLQHDIRLGLRNNPIQTYYYSLLLDAGIRDYSIQLDDSLIHNKYKAFSVEAIYEVAILRDFKLTFEDNFIYKIYHTKSSLEPDYYWNYMRPGLGFQLLDNFEIGAGYEWEFKEHISSPVYEYNVNEQNYNSDGMFFSLNYFSISGFYISSSLSYQWRRYPSSITNDLISIYSNQNIFSIMFIAYIPISDHLYLNSFITYDNDQDIDFDQQNNRSTIITFDLEYIF